MLNSYSAKRNQEDGFTLIELLVVVIIIGILAAIALPIFIDQQKVAIDASVMSDTRNGVTNITGAQAQGAGTVATLPQSRSNTKFTLDGSDVADTDAAKAGVQFAVPALGTPYKLAATNDGGKKYKADSFEFDSSTGKFTTVSAAAGGTGGGGNIGGGSGVPAGTVAYQSNFASGVDGWDPSTSVTYLSRSSFNGNTSSAGSINVHTVGNGTTGAIKTITGLVVGQSYKVDVQVQSEYGMDSVTHSATVSVNGSNSVKNSDIRNSAHSVSTTFTATATSADVSITSEPNAGPYNGVFYIFDVKVAAN